MGQHSIRLLKFAIKYQNNWHSYGKDISTVRAIKRLSDLGFIEINQIRQFRLIK